MKTKTTASSVLLIGLLMIVISFYPLPPVGVMFFLFCGAVLAGTGGTMYSSEMKKEKQAERRHRDMLRYGRAA